MHAATGTDRSAVRIFRVAEAEIGKDLSLRLTSLLQECFSGYPGRSYFKLPPHFRYVAVTGDSAVVAQMGVELRMIRVGDTVLRTFGLVDVCVTPGQRSRGLAAELLSEVTELAQDCEVDFIVLFADDTRLYAANGWNPVASRCSWVKIDEHRTLDLARRTDTGAMMVKAIGDRSWPPGDVDLLGHLF